MTKRERQLLGCLATCIGAPPPGEGAAEVAFSTMLGAFARLLGTPVLTFGLQEIATRRVLFSAKAETEVDDPAGEPTWSSIPADTGVLRSLFRVVPTGDGQHRVLLGGMSDVPDDEPIRQILATIVPRLAERALLLRKRREEPVLSLAERAFDLLPFPALVLRDDGVIALENRAARAVLDEGGPLQRRGGALHVQQGDGDARLRHLLAEVSADGASATMFSLPRDGQRPLSLLLSRVAPPRRGREPDRGHALALVCDPLHKNGGVRELLIRSYGLTGSEARVALAVLDGKSVEQLAGELYISLNTAKTHLKSIFAKVGTCRQSELVAAILSGPIGLLR